MAELALIDNNKKMRLVGEVVARQQKEQVAVRIAAEASAARGGAEAEDDIEISEPNRSETVEGEDSECHTKLEAMGQKNAKLETELEAARKELVLKVKEQEVAEEEG